MINLKDKNEQYLIFSLILVLILHNIPSISIITYPFNLLATWIHEMGHGLTAEMFGGDFKKLVINADTSGYASYLFPAGHNFARGIIASAGYMGTSIFGAMMLYFRKKDTFVKIFSLMLGIFMVLSLLIYIRSITGWLFGVPFSLLLLFVGLKSDSDINLFFYNFIASQIALNAILDINVLFSVGNSRGGVTGMTLSSDASVMSEVWIGPYWFWASVWLIISVTLFGYTYLKPLGSSKKKIENSL